MTIPTSLRLLAQDIPEDTHLLNSAADRIEELEAICQKLVDADDYDYPSDAEDALIELVDLATKAMETAL